MSFDIEVEQRRLDEDAKLRWADDGGARAPEVEIYVRWWPGFAVFSESARKKLVYE